MVEVNASDADASDNQTLTYRYWFFKIMGEVKGKLVTGPLQGDSEFDMQLPSEPGEYSVYCQVDDGRGKVAVHHFPIKVLADVSSQND